MTKTSPYQISESTKLTVFTRIYAISGLARPSTGREARVAGGGRLAGRRAAYFPGTYTIRKAIDPKSDLTVRGTAETVLRLTPLPGFPLAFPEVLCWYILAVCWSKSI